MGNKTFCVFLLAVLRKWGWLVTGVVGGGFFYANLLGINPVIARPIGIVVLVICFFFACYLAYRDLYLDHASLLQKPAASSPTVLRRTIFRRPDYRQRDTINNIVEAMKRLHGHSDDAQIERDYLDGVLASDLLSRNCTECGKPRNQQGDYLHGL